MKITILFQSQPLDLCAHTHIHNILHSHTSTHVHTHTTYSHIILHAIQEKNTSKPQTKRITTTNLLPKKELVHKN